VLVLNSPMVNYNEPEEVVIYG